MGQAIQYTTARLFGPATKDSVSFPKVVDKFVEGGDLLFMEARAHFDEYTIMNS